MFICENQSIVFRDRLIDRITFFQNSFFSFEFRSFEKEVRVGQVRLGDLGNVRG